MKHVPQRTCVGCHETLSKRTLVRVVRNPQGVSIDLTGKAKGRGAYIHNQRSCWEKALKGTLAHALKVEISEAEKQSLIAYLDRLTDDKDKPKPDAP